MQVLICKNGVVLSKAETNLTIGDDLLLISVGDCTVHLVADDDTHCEGDNYDPQAAAKAQAEAEAAAKAQAEAEAAATQPAAQV
jgi:hypothetical protein